MKKISFVLALLGVCCFAPALNAQTAAGACPSTKTIDELVSALDAAVSGPADKDRTCFRRVFTEDAQLVPLAKGPDGSLVPRTLTVDGWIAAVKKHGSEVFYEKQIKYTSDVYGHMAQIWSTYETRSTPDGKALDRGINSIEAVKDGQEWKAEHILWEAERPGETVPEQYLPAQK
ncbi:MAG TPA: hypothetical protein VFW25_01655 [Silvibacterium sp.]|nr:hypothetical protein [Silvibacterium sp.]